MKLQNTLVFQLFFFLAKLTCILLGALAGIVIGSATIIAFGLELHLWMFGIFGPLSAIGALTVFETMQNYAKAGPDDYIDFLPGGYWKRGTWWTTPRLVAYWGAMPGFISGFMSGALWSLSGELLILPVMTLAFTALTTIGALVHYRIRSSISWLPFE